MGSLHQQVRERPLIGATNESGKELADYVRLSVFQDVMLPRQSLEAPFVQQGSNLIE